MAERLTDEELNNHERALPFLQNQNPLVVAAARSLLTEVRERRAAAHHPKNCDTFELLVKAHDRISELEACLRECLGDDVEEPAHLYTLGMNRMSAKTSEAFDAAEAEAVAITDRARAALAKGGT